MDTGNYMQNQMSNLIENSKNTQVTFNSWLYKAIEIFCKDKKQPHDIYPLVDLSRAKLSFVYGITSEEYSLILDI